jgi:Ca-activated chloride channel family protein
MKMILGNENALWLFFIVPCVLVPLYLWSRFQKNRLLKRFVEPKLLPIVDPQSSRMRNFIKAVMIAMAVSVIIFGLCEPKWNPMPKQVKSRGRDIVVLFDVSRSMLAEDVTPSRLEKAKLAVGDLIKTLKGDRIAIVTFAGNSTIKCPLTQDYAFVRMAMEEIGTESAGRGGTMIGDAIRDAVRDVFDEKSGSYKDIVLISDGEDHESYPVEAAAQAGEAGVRIIAIAIGDQKQGARIPVYDHAGRASFLTYQGEQVWSKVDGSTLKSVAAASDDGRYLAVEPATAFDMGAIYGDLIASAEKRELDSLKMLEYEQRFQVFLALGFVLITLESFTRERK